MRSLPRLSVENPILVNLLMLTIIIGGLYGGLTLVREMFPESRPNQVLITTVYPGATPAEIEKGLATRLEEAIKDVEYIEKIEATITEGLSSIVVTMTNEVKDLNQTINDFKAAVDTVPRDELPKDAEETRVAKFEPRLPVISIAIFGDVDEDTLKATGRRVRDDLLLMPGITDVELSGIRKDELAVEVSPEKLIEYRLSLAQVAAAIRDQNLDLPGGQLKTADQNIAVRTLGETDDVNRIKDTIVRTTTSGQLVRVRDLGRVLDGFEDSDVRGRFNGKPAVDITVYKTGDQDAIDIATKVKAYVAGKRREPLPMDWMDRLRLLFGMQFEAQRVHAQAVNEPIQPHIEMLTTSDLSRFIEDRLDLLKRNGLWGLLFVFLSLLLFLNWRVAFWVMMGLVLSVCGSILLMKAVGATLNLISMFGLIVVLGLIVDDAIVVGENVYARIERGEEPKLAAVLGTEEVTWPVIIAVLTTIAAFLPLRLMEGRMGDFMGVLPVIVTCALTVSLLEALSILPSHLAEWLAPVRRDLGPAPPRHWLAKLVRPIREKQKHILVDRMGRRYEQLLRLAVRYRYVTVAAAVAMLMTAVGLVGGGRVPFVFIEKVDSELVTVSLEMPVGSPVDRTEAAMKRVEDAALALPDVRTVYTLVGGSMDIGQSGFTSSHRSHL
ncbi:MAG: efflux RND transporter permease subunit, partial [Phycisphaerae bacterium]|nr:efflux RND transporter permease subunit [Phycisphaerae bacterium]